MYSPVIGLVALTTSQNISEHLRTDVCRNLASNHQLSLCFEVAIAGGTVEMPPQSRSPRATRAMLKKGGLIEQLEVCQQHRCFYSWGITIALEMGILCRARSL